MTDLQSINATEALARRIVTVIAQQGAVDRDEIESLALELIDQATQQGMALTTREVDRILAFVDEAF